MRGKITITYEPCEEKLKGYKMSMQLSLEDNPEQVVEDFKRFLRVTNSALTDIYLTDLTFGSQIKKVPVSAPHIATNPVEYRLPFASEAKPTLLHTDKHSPNP